MYGGEALQLHASYGRNYIAAYLSAVGLVSALPNASPYRGLKPPLQVFSHCLPVNIDDESAISIRYRPCEFLARFFPFFLCSYIEPSPLPRLPIILSFHQLSRVNYERLRQFTDSRHVRLCLIALNANYSGWGDARLFCKVG